MPVVQYQETLTNTADNINDEIKKILVVGAGPVGVRFVTDYLRRNSRCAITLFGNEPYEPYNRVQLSQLLSREKDYADITTTFPKTTAEQQFDYINASIESIDTTEKTVVSSTGEQFHYDALVLATGSRPHVPNIPGVHLTGVYTFRNLRDTEALLTRRTRSRRTVVVGAGLLGLEAARALVGNGTEVVVVQQSSRLMNRQLDEMASAKLREHIEALGIKVITQSGVREIVSDSDRVEEYAEHNTNKRVIGVVTRDKEFIECDTVLLCTGIQPNIELAMNHNIGFASGIRVDDQLQTSVDGIYAIGECCEHNGQVYGIVSPGLEQAAVLADRLSGGDALYHGTQLISTLKVVGESVTSMGEVSETTQRIHQSEIAYHDKKNGIYRKLVVHKGKIIGACSVGEWDEARRVQESFLSESYFFPWQRWYFSLTGKLWFAQEKQQVADWPATSIICQCNQITRGQLSEAVESGCSSIAALGVKTGAGTVCGSCQPLLSNLVTQDNPTPVSVIGGIPLAVSSFIAAIITLLLFTFPGVPAAESVQEKSMSFLWSDGFWKQVSGFSLLGLIAIGLFMTLRKRAGWKFLGDFSYWRVVHTVLGALALGVLFLHTGAHLGENLNRLLMINFLVVSIVGAVAGFCIYLTSKFAQASLDTVRKGSFWTHILVVWPLPALLIVHIFSVYYY